MSKRRARRNRGRAQRLGQIRPAPAPKSVVATTWDEYTETDPVKVRYWQQRMLAKLPGGESEPAPRRVPSKGERRSMRAAGNQAHYLKPSNSVGMIKSQQHRPARPSDKLLRELRLAAARRAAREAAKDA